MNSNPNKSIGQLLSKAPIIPVITVHKTSTIVALAKTLVGAGLPILEVTLRTECALEAITEIKEQVPDAIIGAGSVNTPDLFRAAYNAGCAFAVSPGYTPALLECAATIPLPYLPGVTTPSDVMCLSDQGYRYLKLFPAEAVGGIPLLKAISAPLPHMKFCPTGGITAANAADYLALPNVICAGGSWMVKEALVANEDWSEIDRLARQAAALG